MMRTKIALVCAVFLLGGCAPKIGKDIVLEPQGNVRWENSETEMVLSVLSLFGLSDQGGAIRLGSDLLVKNHWHSDIKVVSIHYTLSDGKEVFAQGEMKSAGSKTILIPSGAQTNIPLTFRIDPKHLNGNRIAALLQAKRKFYVRGEAVIEVWGIEKHHQFDKEVTTVIQKALSGA